MEPHSPKSAVSHHFSATHMICPSDYLILNSQQSLLANLYFVHLSSSELVNQQDENYSDPLSCCWSWEYIKSVF